MKKSNEVADFAKAGKKIDLRIENIESLYPEDRDRIQRAFASLGVDADLCYISKGPTVVRIALCLPKGMKYSRIIKLADKLQRALSVSSLRIEAPIPGMELVGIEFPRSNPERVKFSDLCRDDWYGRRPEEIQKVVHLPVVFGKDIDANVLTCDLASAPHMLIGGAPGQGALQFVHSVICGLVASRTPEEVQFILADPKCVELAPYSKLANLVVPLITDKRKVVFSLRWAVAEMESRLKMFAKAWVRNIEDFNLRDPAMPKSDMFAKDLPPTDLPATVPHIVIVITDFDEAMAKDKGIKSDILRLAAKSRAAGIHLILETECMDKKALPSELTANIPVRVAFRTASAKDSKVILDDAGAETLIGQGDALVKDKDGTIRRIQTPDISDAEVDAFVASNVKTADSKTVSGAMLRKDYRKAYEVVVRTQRASTSHLQRHMGIGYMHAARIMDELEKNGVVGPQTGSGPRKVLVAMDSIQRMSDMTISLLENDKEVLCRMAKEKRVSVSDLVAKLVHEMLMRCA